MKELWCRHQVMTSETQEIASKKIGISQSSFCQFLSGKLTPNPTFILKFSKLVGVNPAKIRPSFHVFFGESKGKKLYQKIDNLVSILNEGKNKNE